MPDAGAVRIDECLSVRGDRLFVEECDAYELAERFGTPIYVVSENQLRRNARRLMRAFSDHWDGPVQVLPSI
jgi:diaminopimelate decarboxylase